VTVSSVVSGGDAQQGVAAGPTALEVRGLAKTFGDKTVLHHFDLTVEAGQVHMLLGQNGSGKSTLIKILAGFHQPDVARSFTVGGRSVSAGSAEQVRAAGLRFVHQELGLIGPETVLDNMLYSDGFPTRFGQISSGRARKRVMASLELVGLDIDPASKVDTLSPAQRTGVAVARALMDTGDAAVALVLDEPTATLPGAEVERLHAILRVAVSRGVGVLYVTHHLDEVEQLGDVVSVLRDGHLVAAGPVVDLPRDVIVHALVGGELEAVQNQARPVTAPDEADPVLQVRELVGDRVDGLSFDAAPGEILGLYGLTGSGREAALGMIFGSIPRASGTVRVDATPVMPNRPRASMEAGVSYVPADRKSAGLFLELTAQENLTLSNLRPFWRRGRIDRRAERAEVDSWFKRLAIRPADGAGQTVGTFSGGNQQKVVMAKWLRLNPDVLLLDEPTQGVDVGAKAELHRQLLASRADGTAIVVSSSDVDELVTLCDRVLIIRDGRVHRELVGDDITDHNINRGFLEASTSTNG